MNEDEIMKDYDEMWKKIEDDRKYFNDLYLEVIRRNITQYKYKKLIEFLYGDGIVDIKGIVRKNKIKGEYQKENYWFKYIYITQNVGYCGDDYSGEIFIPITEKNFLHFYFEC